MPEVYFFLPSHPNSAWHCGQGGLVPAHIMQRLFLLHLLGQLQQVHLVEARDRTTWSVEVSADLTSCKMQEARLPL
jgi:hypothetical protein